MTERDYEFEVIGMAQCEVRQIVKVTAQTYSIALAKAKKQLNIEPAPVLGENE